MTKAKLIEAKKNERKIREDSGPVQIEKTTLKPGDLIEVRTKGNVFRIMCGDATNPADVKKLMNGRKADLATNDPPYGMKKEKDGVKNDNLNFEDLLQFNKKWIATQLKHVKPNGSFYCFGQDEPLMDIYVNIFKPLIRSKAATFRNLITWDKKGGRGQNSEQHRMFATTDEKILFFMLGAQDMEQTADKFPKSWEPILEYLRASKKKAGWTNKEIIKLLGTESASHYFARSQFLLPNKEQYEKMRDLSKGQAFTKPHEELKLQESEHLKTFRENRAYFNNVHDNMNNVWRITRVEGAKLKDAGNHATPKPLKLMGRIIKSSCPPGGLVIDFFGGSGSTLIAAQRLERDCYIMELLPEMVEGMISRLLRSINVGPLFSEQQTASLSINGINTPIIDR